jgi:hypothetical protein
MRTNINYRLALALVFVLATIVLYASRYYWLGAITLVAGSLAFTSWWSDRADGR